MLGLCERFGCLPSQLADEPADPLMRMLRLEALGGRFDDAPQDD